MTQVSKIFISATLAASMLAPPAFATDWQVSLWGGRRIFTEHVEELARLVNERTNGEFTIALHYGGELAPGRENLEGIAANQFEMAQFCAGYHPEKNRTLTVLELPFLGVETLEEERLVSEAVYAHPATQAELAQWNARILMPTPLPQYNLVGRGAPLDGLEDFDGMDIRATGGIGQAFALLGADPQSLTASEVMPAMEAGEIDTVAFAPHAHFAFRTIERAEWWTANLNPGTLNCPVVVNIDAYEALPEAHRAALDAAIEPAMRHYLLYYRDLIYKWDEILEMLEVERLRLDAPVVDRFREIAADQVRETWLEEMRAAGVPGNELFDLVMATLAASRQ